MTADRTSDAGPADPMTQNTEGTGRGATPPPEHDGQELTP